MKTTLKENITAIAVILVAVAVITFFVVDNKKEDKIYIPNTPSATSEMKQAFMEGCVVDGGGEFAQCDCMYNALVKKYGMTKFIEVATEYDATGEMPTSFVETILTCY